MKDASVLRVNYSSGAAGYWFTAESDQIEQKRPESFAEWRLNAGKFRARRQHRERDRILANSVSCRRAEDYIVQ